MKLICTFMVCATAILITFFTVNTWKDAQDRDRRARGYEFVLTHPEFLDNKSQPKIDDTATDLKDL